MLIVIDPSDPRPIYRQIIDEVRRGLVVGSLNEGDPLPSVRQLAGELRVNPNTVQQAYRELERQGVAFVRRGLGTFVSELESVDGERQTLARALAERVLREAFRLGLSVEQLIAALRDAQPGGNADQETPQ